MRLSTLFAAVALCCTATPAIADPVLVSADPAADATVARTTRVRLIFSEPVVARSSGAQIAMTAMPGMASHAPMKMAAKASVGPDGKSLVLTFARPLVKGSYRVDWHVATADTHRVTGSYSFTIA